MSTITVRMNASTTASVNQGPGLPQHPKLTVRNLTGTVHMAFPFAPQGGSRAGLAPVYARTPRPGRTDAIDRQYEPTDTLSLRVDLMRHSVYDSVEPYMTALNRLARQSDCVILQGYAPAELGPWFITDLSHEITDRQPGTNEATRATSSITFTRATASSVTHGPLAERVNNGYGSTLVVPNHATYRTKKGERLSTIAVRVYGTSSAMNMLATVNRIRYPSRQLRTGTVLKTPQALVRVT